METMDTLQTLLSRLKAFAQRKAVVAFGKDQADQWTYAKLADEGYRDSPNWASQRTIIRRVAGSAIRALLVS